jgi:hypothetical protein
MTVHVSTEERDYFFHSHEVRETYYTNTDVVIKLIHPIGVKVHSIGAKDKIYITTNEAADVHSMILEAIKADKNISIQVRSFQIP